jgi:Yip1 domain
MNAITSAKHARAAVSPYLRRLMGAAVLDRATYEEVEADENATMQAFATVLLSSLAAGLGSRGLGGSTLANFAFFGTVALLSWAIWAVITFEIGVRLMPEPQTRSNVGELLRTIGFATAPGCLRVLGILPGSTILVFALSAVWMLAAMVVAVRQALDYESTTRALAVCALGWVLAMAMAVVLGVAFGPSVS